MTDSIYWVKSTPLRAFIGSFQDFAVMFTDILKMCMKKFDAAKNIFDKLLGFLTKTYYDYCT